MLVGAFITAFFFFSSLCLKLCRINPTFAPCFVGSVLEQDFTVLNWGLLSWFQLNYEREQRDPWKSMNIDAED